MTACFVGEVFVSTIQREGLSGLPYMILRIPLNTDEASSSGSILFSKEGREF